MSDIDSTSRNQDSSTNEHIRVKFLSTREVIILGALGGIITNMLAQPGIVQLEFSDISFVDLFDFVGSAILGALMGGAWAFVNMPDYDRKRILQCGMIAPATFVAFTFGKESLIDEDVKSKEEQPAEQTQKGEKGSHFTIIDEAYAATLSSVRKDLHTVFETASKKKKRKRPWWIRIWR